jgi:hypothetical protein
MTMCKRILLCLWLLIPVALLAYHYGPGRARLAQDRAAQKIAQAQALEAKEDWQGAFQSWGEALAATPQDQTGTRFQLRLAQARTRMYTGELPEAIEDLGALLEEAQGGASDQNLRREIRATLAGAQYYAGWLMRLESAPAEEWLLPVEEARQHFRLLAEETGDSKAGIGYKRNLEAAIRLERMDLSELQGLPLPKFCSACKDVSQKCRSQRESKCENKPEEKKDARGAGFNQVPKGGS